MVVATYGPAALSSTPGPPFRMTSGQLLLLMVDILPENLPALCLLPVTATLCPQGP